MSPSFRRHRTLSVALLLLALLAMLLPAAGASADIVGAKEIPGFPKYGCYDVVVGGNGMWGGKTPYPITVDVPGPVVNAYLQWIGTEDAGAPGAPAASDLTVNGATVVGQLTHQFQSGPNEQPWYIWRADIGPSGANLVQQGVNKYNISGWNIVAPSGYRQNGISVVVVYDTGACAKPNQVDAMDSFTWYWERNGGVSDVVSFTFPPSPNDRDITVWLHNAGATHVRPQAESASEEAYSPDAVDPSACRGMNLWAKAGTGNPPPTLVEYSNTPPTSAYGGKLVVTNPFVGSNCNNTTWTWPVTSLLGWVDAQGWTPDTGGYIAPEWSIIRITYRIRAGETYLALQLESEKTGAEDVLLTGESAAWFAQAVIPLEDIKLRVTKTDGVTTAKPGDTLTYTIDYENYGPTPAANTTLVDTLPANATFVSASNGGTLSGDGKTVNWNLGTVAAGAKGQVTLTVKLDPIFPAGKTTLTNTVVIATPGEADTSDNTATDTTDVVAQATLDVEKTGAPEPVGPGDNLTYTINWTVGGDAFSQDVKLVDKLPANVSFVSAGNGGTYDQATGTVTWSLGDITPTKNGSVSLVVKVNADQKKGDTITNVATLTNAAGDKDEDTFVNTVITSSLLTLTKTNNLAEGAKAQPGDQVIWTLGYTVEGNGVSKNVTITDLLPAEVEFVSASNGGTFANGVVTWKLGDLPGGTTGSVTLTVKLKASLTGVTEITNTATIKDDDGNTDDATDVVPVGLMPALTVTKKNTPTGEVKPGDTITYEVCMSNSGQADATNAVMTDVIPVNTTYVAGSATGGATYNEATRTLTWKKSSLAPNEKVCGTFQVKVNTVITGLTGQKNVAMKFNEWNAVSIDNTVTASADGIAPKSATVSNPLVATVNPLIFKSANRSEALVGDEIIFTLTVRNDGTAAATNVVVTDGIPTKLDAVTATTTKGVALFDPNTRVLTVTIGQLDPAETVTVTIKGKAASAPAEQLPYTMTNEAVVSFTEGAPRTSNRVTVTVNGLPPFEIPEPGTWLLLGTGLAGLAGYTRMRAQARRRK